MGAPAQGTARGGANPAQDQARGQGMSGGDAGGFTSFQRYMELNPNEAQRAADRALNPLDTQLQGARTGLANEQNTFNQQMAGNRTPTYQASWWQQERPGAADQESERDASRQSYNQAYGREGQGQGVQSRYPTYLQPNFDAAAARAQGMNYNGPQGFGSSSLRDQMQQAAMNIGLLNRGPSGWEAAANPGNFAPSWGSAAQGAFANQGGNARATQMSGQQRDLGNQFNAFGKQAETQIGDAKQGWSDLRTRMQNDLPRVQEEQDQYQTQWDRAQSEDERWQRARQTTPDSRGRRPGSSAGGTGRTGEQ